MLAEIAPRPAAGLDIVAIEKRGRSLRRRRRTSGLLLATCLIAAGAWTSSGGIFDPTSDQAAATAVCPGVYSPVTVFLISDLSTTQRVEVAGRLYRIPGVSLVTRSRLHGPTVLDVSIDRDRRAVQVARAVPLNLAIQGVSYADPRWNCRERKLRRGVFRVRALKSRMHDRLNRLLDGAVSRGVPFKRAISRSLEDSRLDALRTELRNLNARLERSRR
jgi:hypothetical protein